MAHSCGLSEMCLGIKFLCPMNFGGLFSYSYIEVQHFKILMSS